MDYDIRNGVRPTVPYLAPRIKRCAGSDCSEPNNSESTKDNKGTKTNLDQIIEMNYPKLHFALHHQPILAPKHSALKGTHIAPFLVVPHEGEFVLTPGLVPTQGRNKYVPTFHYRSEKDAKKDVAHVFLLTMSLANVPQSVARSALASVMATYE